VTVRSHSFSGAAQLASLVQPAPVVHWPAPVPLLHVVPSGHPSPAAGPQPGVQKPPGPLQTRPVSVPHPSLVPPASQPQMPSAVRQTGVSPVHRAVFVGEHCVQAPASGPPAWQTGRAGSEHVGGPLPVHATQVRVAGEQ
jgi:hypothetical protein